MRVSARHAFSYSSLCLTQKLVIVSPRLRRKVLKYALKAFPTSGRTGSEIAVWRCAKSRCTPSSRESQVGFFPAMDALAGPLNSVARRGPHKYLLLHFVDSTKSNAALRYSVHVDGSPSQDGTPSRLLPTVMVGAASRKLPQDWPRGSTRWPSRREGSVPGAPLPQSWSTELRYHARSIPPGSEEMSKMSFPSAFFPRDQAPMAMVRVQRAGTIFRGTLGPEHLRPCLS